MCLLPLRTSTAKTNKIKDAYSFAPASQGVSDGRKVAAVRLCSIIDNGRREKLENKSPFK